MDMENYVNRHGIKGKEMLGALLNTLNKNEQFFNALQSPLGRELSADLVIIIAEKLDKIVDETADDKDRADFKAAKNLQARWANRINEYDRSLKQFKEG